jgi:hypothetical protein
MRVRPIALREACAFVNSHHRHNKPPQGHRFSIALWSENVLFGCETLVGVAVIGRPVARHLDDGITAEVTRLCVLDEAPLGSCSKLYGAAWRAWREMGGERIVTYTLQSESGASLRGAGWKRDAELDGNTGPAWTNRAGRAAQAVVAEAKVRWLAHA